MINLASVAHRYGGNDVNINYLTAEALVMAGVLDRAGSSPVSDTITIHFYEKAGH